MNYLSGERVNKYYNVLYKSVSLEDLSKLCGIHTPTLLRNQWGVLAKQKAGIVTIGTAKRPYTKSCLYKVVRK